MAATEKTFTIVGDLKKSTANVRTHSLYSFSVPIVVTDQIVFDETIADGATWTVPLDSLADTGAEFLFLLMDDNQDGKLNLQFNGAPLENAVPLGPKGMLIVALTGITSLVVSNDSGNSAGLIVAGGSK